MVVVAFHDILLASSRVPNSKHFVFGPNGVVLISRNDVDLPFDSVLSAHDLIAESSHFVILALDDVGPHASDVLTAEVGAIGDRCSCYSGECDKTEERKFHKRTIILPLIERAFIAGAGSFEWKNHPDIV